MTDFKVPSLLLPAKKQEDKIISEEQDAPEESLGVQKFSIYKVPSWSEKPPSQLIYKFEVLKSGQIIDEIRDLQCQAVWKFGRLQDNDIEMAHPTISRYHAILQYKPKDKEEDDVKKMDLEDKSTPEGWYIYDLDSTHGTFLNKQRVPPRVYIRIRVGHMLRLGASTRSYILNGPVEDEEPESTLSVTELRILNQRKKDGIINADNQIAETKDNTEKEGIDWGMGEDADENTDLAENPYACSNNEELFLDDPKRTLRGYFEREGLSLEYKCDEMSAGSFVCRVDLPIDDTFGRPIVAEVVHKGRKKDCVAQCALEACRILDRHGVLRQSNQEPQKRKVKTQDSDSDEDEFWDRTGDVQRKKMRKSKQDTSEALTYEDLLKQNESLAQLKTQIEDKIRKYHESQTKNDYTISEDNADCDELDNFMEKLSNDNATKLDKIEIKKLHLEKQRLDTEQLRVHRLITITKPTEISLFQNEKPAGPHAAASNENKYTKKLPLIGKRNQFSKFKITKKSPVKSLPSSRIFCSDEEEVEEGNDVIFSNENNEEVKVEDIEISKITEQPNDEVILKESSKSEESKNEVTKSDTSIEFGIENNVIDSSVNRNSDHDSERKRRVRIRPRSKRQDVNVEQLEEQESDEKYIKWVPPNNQTGDGFTDLNKKYGY